SALRPLYGTLFVDPAMRAQKSKTPTNFVASCLPLTLLQYDRIFGRDSHRIDDVSRRAQFLGEFICSRKHLSHPPGVNTTPEAVLLLFSLCVFRAEASFCLARLRRLFASQYLPVVKATSH